MNPEAKTTSTPPESNVRAFALTSLFNDISSEMAYWILPAFISSIGGTAAQLGVIEGIAEFIAAFGKLWSGLLADTLRRRKPLVAGGYAVANIVKPFLAVATSWWQVLLVRFADRASKGIRGSARDVMLAESAAPERLGSAYGFVQAADSAGAILGPLIALWMLSGLHVSMRTVFWTAAIPGALCVFVITRFVRETPRGAVTKALDWRGGTLPRNFWAVLATVTLFSLGNSSDMFLVLRAKELGIAVALAPLLGLIFNSVYTAASWPAGALSDRVSRHVIASAGYVVYALAYAVFAFAPRVTSHVKLSIWCAMAFYGLYYAMTQPVLTALVVSGLPKETRGRGIGIYNAVTSVCVLISSAATGYLWRHFGGQCPLGISAALALAASLGLLVVGQRDSNRSTTSGQEKVAEHS